MYQKGEALLFEKELKMYDDFVSLSSSSSRSRRGFRSTIRGLRTSSTDVVAVDATERGRTTTKSPYKWLKSTAHELEIKGKCRSLVARIGRKGGRKRHGSADLSYDPLTYALNFEEDRVYDEEFHPVYASRLPASRSVRFP
ncbi:uncharacterized protein LOC110807047 [Carica papaya]|uniref:uncharacterized protein LOC110807047 n=1 Tax=Carica papaya TaxID=3649 RepID=UPI000B8D1A20|nr:uncharacterized protein LOC110807047 [Carica papaya]